jgi:hypothetical protein
MITVQIEITKSTLGGIEILPGKGRGNTTRIINQAVEDLFKGYKLLVHDHFEDGQNRYANRSLLNSILDRLLYEHRINLGDIKVEYIGQVPTIELV